MSDTQLLERRKLQAASRIFEAWTEARRERQKMQPVQDPLQEAIWRIVETEFSPSHSLELQ